MSTNMIFEIPSGNATINVYVTPTTDRKGALAQAEWVYPSGAVAKYTGNLPALVGQQGPYIAYDRLRAMEYYGVEEVVRRKARRLVGSELARRGL